MVIGIVLYRKSSLLHVALKRELEIRSLSKHKCGIRVRGDNNIRTITGLKIAHGQSLVMLSSQTYFWSDKTCF